MLKVGEHSSPGNATCCFGSGGGVGIALGLMSLNDSISGYPAMFDCDGTLPPMDTLLGNSVNQVRDQ